MKAAPLGPGRPAIPLRELFVGGSIGTIVGAHLGAPSKTPEKWETKLHLGLGYSF